MARIRSVHPGFFKDEDLLSVSMAARLLFLGLGTEADDKGVFEWKLITLKINIFPLDNVDMASLLGELEGANAVRMFETGGKKYGAIRNFQRYQRPKKPNDIHPITDEIRIFVGSRTDGSELVTHQYGTDGEKSPQMEDGGGSKEGSVRVSNETLTLASESDWKEFSETYPQPSGLKAARTAWERVVSSGIPPSEIITGLKASVAYWKREGVAGRWIPKAETWLNDDGWTHHIGVTPTGKPAVTWGGPAEVRKAVVAAIGDTGAASYLDPAVWKTPGIIETTTAYAADKLRPILPDFTIRKREAA
jgi:hypothetical protein